MATTGIVARWAEGTDDIDRALGLRAMVFRSGRCDRDRFDGLSRHLLVERAGRLAATLRLRRHDDPTSLGSSYTGQSYDLSGLALPGPALEIGRLCIADAAAPDVLRATWAALAREVDQTGAALLLGCSSLPGAAADRYGAGLAALRPYLLPRSGPRARGAALDIAAIPDRPDPSSLPATLRSYLTLGARIGTDAVIDADLDTVHVFTLLRVADVPPGRARVLRALAGAVPG